MDDGDDYSGSKTSVFTILSLDDTDVEVYCEVSALLYGQPVSIISDTVSVIIALSGCFDFNKHPIDAAVCNLGSPAVFEVDVFATDAVTDITYQ